MVARHVPMRPGGQRTPIELQDVWWQISSHLGRIVRSEPVAGLGDLPVGGSGFPEEKSSVRTLEAWRLQCGPAALSEVGWGGGKDAEVVDRRL